jgi:hypothetical protein
LKKNRNPQAKAVKRKKTDIGEAAGKGKEPKPPSGDGFAGIAGKGNNPEQVSVTLPVNNLNLAIDGIHPPHPPQNDRSIVKTAKVASPQNKSRTSEEWSIWARTCVVCGEISNHDLTMRLGDGYQCYRCHAEGKNDKRVRWTEADAPIVAADQKTLEAGT